MASPQSSSGHLHTPAPSPTKSHHSRHDEKSSVTGMGMGISISPTQTRQGSLSPLPEWDDYKGDNVGANNAFQVEPLKVPTPPPSELPVYKPSRDRARTEPTARQPPTTISSSSIPTTRLRAESANAQHSPHPRIDLAGPGASLSTVLGPSIQHPPQYSSPAPDQVTVAALPIDIPVRPTDKNRPTTPLSGRFERPSYLSPYHAPSTDPFNHQQQRFALKAPSVTTTNRTTIAVPSMMSPRSSQHQSYHPSSPLSPITSAPIAIPSSATAQQRPRRPQHNLQLPGLPKYHPANFPSSDSNAPVSPRSVRTLSSTHKIGRGSDAQQKLYQYQRDVIAGAAKHSSVSGALPGSLAKPTSPRLLPLGSPADSVTPLALEAKSDYMLAGSKTPQAMDETGPREWVEKLVQKENERRAHPEARSGSLSPSISPAISPAGGPY